MSIKSILFVILFGCSIPVFSAQGNFQFQNQCGGQAQSYGPLNWISFQQTSEYTNFTAGELERAGLSFQNEVGQLILVIKDGTKIPFAQVTETENKCALGGAIESSALLLASVHVSISEVGQSECKVVPHGGASERTIAKMLTISIMGKEGVTLPTSSRRTFPGEHCDSSSDPAAAAVQNEFPQRK